MDHLADGVLAAIAAGRAATHLVRVPIGSRLLLHHDVRWVPTLRGNIGRSQHSAMNAQSPPDRRRRRLIFALVLIPLIVCYVGEWAKERNTEIVEAGISNGLSEKSIN